MRLIIALLAVLLLPLITAAAEIAVGDCVFLKDGAEATIDGVAVNSRQLPIRMTVAKVDDDWLLLGRAWVRACDVLTQEEALAAYDRQVLEQPAEASGWKRRAFVRWHLSQFDDVVSDLTEVIRKEPTDATAYTNRAAAWARKGELDAALQDCTEAIRIDPKSANAFCSRAAIQAMKKEFESALKDFTEALRLAPNDATACWARGLVLARMDNLDGAIADCDRAIRLDPTNGDAYRSRITVASLKFDFDSALGYCLMASLAVPKSADLHIACGDVWFRKGEFGTAIEQYSTAIALNPQLAQAYYNRSVAWERIGDLDRSLPDLTRAIQHDPKYASVGYLRGSASRRQGDYDNPRYDFAAAVRYDSSDHSGHDRDDDLFKPVAVDSGSIDALSEAIRLDPTNIVAYRRRGRYWVENDHFDDAIADLTEAIRLNPLEAMEYRNRALAYAKKGDFENALRDSDESVRLAPTSPIEFLHRGTIRGMKGDIDDAMADLTEAIRLAPDDATCYGLRGDLRVKKQDWDGALRDYDEALNRNPNHVAIQIRRALPLGESRDFDKVIQVTSAGLDFNPWQSALYYWRAYAWNEKGEYGKAIRDCTEAIRLNPKLEYAIQLRANVRQKIGDFELAMEGFHDVIRLNPKSVLAHEALARFCGSTSDSRYRNGKLAVEHATILCELKEWKDYHSLSLLAMTSATLGDFPNAVKWQAASIEIAPSSEVSVSRERLKFYESRKSYSEKPEPPVSDPLIGCRVFAKVGAEAKVDDVVVDPKWIPFPGTVDEVDGKLIRVGQVWLRRIDVMSSLEAFDFYAKQVQQQPTNAAAWRCRGSVSLSLSQADEAIRDCSEAIRLNPQLAAAYRDRGNAHLSNGNLDRAVEDLSEANRLDPRDPDTCRALAWLKATCAEEPFRQGAEALGLATSACELTAWADWHALDALAATYAETGQYAEAIRWTRASFELAPADGKKILQDRLNVFRSHNPWRDIRTEEENPFATPTFAGAVASEPKPAMRDEDNPFAPTAKVLHEMGTLVYIKDEATVRRGEPLDLKTLPSPVGIMEIDGDLLCLGEAWVHKNDVMTLDQTLEDTSARLRQNPSDIAALERRVSAWRAKGELEEAIKDSANIASIDPDNAAAHHRLAQMWMEKGRSFLGATSDYAKAAAEFTEVIRIDPAFPDVYFQRGLAWARCGHGEFAALDFTESIRLNPKDAKVFHHRALVRVRQLETVKARQDFVESIRLDPDYAEPCNELAWMWATSVQEGDRDGRLARTHAWRACELTGWKSAIHIDTLAAAYAELGDFENAVRWQEKAIDMVRRDQSVAFKKRLKLYQNSKPYRELPQKPGETSSDSDNSWKIANQDANKPQATTQSYDVATWDQLPSTVVEKQAASTSAPANTATDKTTTDDGQKDLDRAIKFHTEAIQLDPKSVASYVDRADLWIKKKELDKALADYTDAIGIDANFSGVYGKRGAVWLRIGDFTRAIEDFTTAIRQEPSGVQAYIAFAWLKAASSSPRCRCGREAVELATKACELTLWESSDALDALAAACAEAGDFANAVKWARKAVEFADEIQSKDCFQRLDLYELEKPCRRPPIAMYVDPRFGERMFVKDGIPVIGEDRDANSNAVPFPATIEDVDGDLLKLGQRWIHKGEAMSTLEALDYYTDQIHHDPSNTLAWRRRACVLYEHRNLERALRDYTHAIDLDPELVDALSGRARIWLLQCEWEEAAQDLLRVIRLNPMDSSACNAIAWLRATCVDERHRDGTVAVALATRACDLTNWSDWEKLGTLAAACAEAGDFANAVIWAQKSVELAPASEKPSASEKLELYCSNNPYRDVVANGPNSKNVATNHRGSSTSGKPDWWSEDATDEEAENSSAGQ